MKMQDIQLDFNFCRPLDFQKNIEIPIINNLFKNILRHQDSLTQKHLKFLLIELFCCWNESENQFLAVSMSKRGYRARSRYNPNMISSHSIKAINYLRKNEFLEFFPGFYDASKKISRLTRIRASKVLKEEFKKLDINTYEILNLKKRENLLLLDSNEKLLEYDDDFFTHEMRDVLRNYNATMLKTFFDIPSLSQSFLIRGDNAKIIISQMCTINKRVYKQNWKQGGSFFGSWWNKLDLKNINDFSNHMLINDSETGHVDLSYLFPTIFSQKIGININTLESEFNMIRKRISFLKSYSQLYYIIIKAVNSGDSKGFYRSFCIDKKKLGIDEKVTYKQFEDVLLNLQKFTPKLYQCFFSKFNFNWNSIVSDIFYGLMQNVGTSNIPIIKVMDKIFYPTKVQKNVINYLYDFISKFINYEKFELKLNKCSAYDFGQKSSIFDSLIGNNLVYSKRFLENKRKFKVLLKKNNLFHN